jgi:glutathione S-transferase
MKLYYSLASPYVRKVRMTALELGLDDRLELVLTDAWTVTEGLPQDNPLCKVPTLVLDDGTPLFDSPVICEYLNSLAGGTLFPPDGPDRWTALRLQALADGLCDAAIARRLETLRPESLRSATWIARQQAAMVRALDALEGRIEELSGAVTIGTLAVATVLGYLDLRFAEDQWRVGRPRLAAWFVEAGRRPSFEVTRPPAP